MILHSLIGKYALLNGGREQVADRQPERAPLSLIGSLRFHNAANWQLC